MKNEVDIIKKFKDNTVIVNILEKNKYELSLFKSNKLQALINFVQD